VTADPTIDIANEFAAVTVRRVATRNGVRLRVEAPRSCTAIDLDPLELEALTWQSHDALAALLRTPPPDGS